MQRQLKIEIEIEIGIETEIAVVAVQNVVAQNVLVVEEQLLIN